MKIFKVAFLASLKVMFLGGSILPGISVLLHLNLRFETILFRVRKDIRNDDSNLGKENHFRTSIQENDFNSGVISNNLD